MKTLKNISLLMLAVLSLMACQKESSSDNPIVVSDKVKSGELINSSNKFAINIFKQLDQNVKDSNLFISPISMVEALSMTYNGAKGENKTEMANVLGFNGFTETQVNEYNQSLRNALTQADNKVIMEDVNSIWYNQYFSVLPSFIDVNKTYYNAEVNALDFTAPSAVDEINGWVNDKTHEKIPTIIDAIPDGVVMYLINAIYFKGEWKYKFDKSYTRNTDFYVNSQKTVQHQQMVTEETFKYTSNKTFDAVKLPYGSGAFSLLMIMPYDIHTFIANLDENSLKNISNSLENKKIKVLIPKFKFELSGELKKTLNQLGMVKAFGGGNFTGIAEKGGIQISRVLHKTFLEVNEEGSEAAAVTAVEVEVTSIEPGQQIPIINFNKPFIYAIMEESTGAVIFMGKMIDPTQTQVEFK